MLIRTDHQFCDLLTPRMALELVTENHAEEFCALLSDPALHVFTPTDPPTLETQLERCTRWSKRYSPDGKEIWLNWIARDLATGIVIGHFQAGVPQDAIAKVAYLIATDKQRMGFAKEGLHAVLRYLRENFEIKQVRAYIDTRNEPSIALVRSLGFQEVDQVPNADFFKGAPSHDVVFGLMD